MPSKRRSGSRSSKKSSIFYKPKMEANLQQNTSPYAPYAEKYFRLLSDWMPQIVWVTDPKGKFEFFNSRWYEYIGRPHMEADLNPWDEFIHPEDLKKVEKKWKRALKSGENYKQEFRIRRGSDGAYLWHLNRAVPVHNNKGEIERWFGSSTNINDQKKIERQKEAVISIASHELKTPLTNIKGYTQMLENLLTKKSHQTIRECLTTLSGCVDQLTGLINNLVEAAKPTSQKIIPDTQLFNFDEMVHAVIKNFQFIVKSHQITIEGFTHTWIYANKIKLEQVLTNLLNNAIKYSPDSNLIKVRLKKNHHEIIVSVIDFGIGIPKEKQSRIFKLFYRVKGPFGRFPGLGVGLYVSSQIVKKHKGKIWVNSEVGKGSVFTFSLPLPKRYVQLFDRSHKSFT